ncbi:TPA: IS66-like element accessory protein TnpA [Burkholderia lata]
MSDTTRNEAAAVVARNTHRVYPLEFKLQLVKETLLPGVSVSTVARKHDINANIVFEWRRLYRLGKLCLPAPKVPKPQSTELLPVNVIDATVREAAGQTDNAPQPCCEVEIEVGKRRLRIRGLSMDRAEQILRDSLQ